MRVGSGAHHHAVALVDRLLAWVDTGRVGAEGLLLEDAAVGIESDGQLEAVGALVGARP
jgi:hypothetical protein